MATMGVSAAAPARLRWLLLHARELAFVAGGYWIYMYTRTLAFNDFGANAATIISFEKSLGFFWVPQWQYWAISSAKHLVIFFNWAYIVTFWPILLVCRDRKQVFPTQSLTFGGGFGIGLC